MRKKAPALDQDAECGREDQNPAGIGVLGNEHRSVVELDIPRIGDHANLAAHDSRAAPETASLVALGDRHLNRRGKRLGVVDHPPGFEPIIRGRHFLVSIELSASNRHQVTERRRRRASFDEGQRFVNLEIEDVAGVFKEVQRTQPAARARERCGAPDRTGEFARAAGSRDRAHAPGHDEAPS